jgi:hypothetical protein
MSVGLAPPTTQPLRRVQRSEPRRAPQLDEGVVVIRCMPENVGVSAIERLPSGGVRLRRRQWRLHLDKPPPLVASSV